MKATGQNTGLNKMIKSMHEDYKFTKNSDALISFIKRNINETKKTGQPGQHENVIGILVTVWPSHTLIFYSIALSLLLRHYNVHPLLIFDDLTENIVPGKIIRAKKLINRVRKTYSELPILYLSQITGEKLDAEDKVQITKLAELNSYYKLKTTVPTAETARTINYYKSDFENIAPHIKGLFLRNKFNSFIIPGGVYGHTGLFLYFGLNQNVRVSSYDSGPGEILIGTDNVAGYLQDIPKIINKFPDIKSLMTARDLAKMEFTDRINRNDPRKFQKIAYSEDKLSEKFDILFPLNIEIDTASLIQKSNFTNMYFWLKETIEYILLNTDAKIAIKDHPSIYNKSESLQNAILDKFGNNERLHFFGRDISVNTYKLINNSRIVLPYTSTVGIESLILGKTVIVENNVYYSNLSGVVQSKSKTEYFDNIFNLLKVDKIITNDQIDEAYVYYYFTQKCNFLKTFFNPTHVDYSKWIHRSIPELLADNNIRLILKSFSQGLPLAELVSVEKLK